MERHDFLTATCLAALAAAAVIARPAALTAASPGESPTASPAAAPADDAAPRPQVSLARVDGALRCEVLGADARRAALLAEALQADPSCAPARWQSGYVKLDGEWVPVGDVPSRVAADPQYAEYLRVRADYADTADAQVELGRWCRQRKLDEQARAHFLRALGKDPDFAEARKALGHRRFAGRWVTDAEIEQARDAAREVRRNLTQWEPKIKRLQRELHASGERHRQRARQGLLAIDDPAAIFALESVLGTSGEEDALDLVDVLDHFPGVPGSVALARQAVFSEWASVRRFAAEKLQHRRREEFVPVMLSRMSKAIRHRRDVGLTPGGEAVVRDTAEAEGWLVRQRVVDELRFRYESTFLTAEELDGLAIDSFPEFGLGESPDQRESLILATVPGLYGLAWQRDVWLAEEQDRARQVNRRIADALNVATGQSLSGDPDTWWEWWNRANEVVVSEKPVQTDYYEQAIVNRPAIDPTLSFSGMHSCFAPSTSVWAVDGPRPIEEVRVGDLVLSQDPETGELAYKPVLATTLREAVDLVRLAVGSETLVCTPGHAFWAAGHGWMQARHLQPGHVLHGVAGTATVDSVRPGPRIAPHNLVVADFHTYFVSRDRLLTHDVTVRRPVTTAVPGLPR